MAGSSAGELDLSAQADRRLVEDDFVARGMRFGGRCHSGRPAADNRDSLPPCGANRRPRQLASRARILGARDRNRRVVMRDADVAADAPEDVLRASICRLARHVRVGDEGPRHPDRFGDAVGDEPVRRGRIDDARRRDQGRADLERRGEAGDRALLDGRRRDDSRRTAVRGRVAQCDREVVDEPGELGRDRDGGFGIGREPHAEREPRRRRPHGFHDRDEKPRSGRPLVLTQVEARREELGKQVVVRGRELDAVQAALGGQLGRARVPGDDLVDLPGGQRAWLDVEALARDRRRRDRGRPRRAGDQLPAAVEELDEEPGPVRAHRVDYAPIAGGDLRHVARQRVGGEEAGLVHGGRLEDDHSGAARRARLVVGDELVGGQVVVDESGLVRSRDDPVAQLDGAERKRAQEVGELRHRARAQGRLVPRL